MYSNFDSVFRFWAISAEIELIFTIAGFDTLTSKPHSHCDTYFSQMFWEITTAFKWKFVFNFSCYLNSGANHKVYMTWR